MGFKPKTFQPTVQWANHCATGTGFSMYLTVSPSTPLIVNPVFYNTRDNNFVQATLLMTTLWRFLKILVLCFCTVVPGILHMQKMCIYVYTEQNIWKKGPDQRGLIPPHLGTSEVCVCSSHMNLTMRLTRVKIMTITPKMHACLNHFLRTFINIACA